MDAKPANPFDAATILDGIRRWVEIETPTEVPAQVNKLADIVADGYRDLPVTIERIAGRDGCGDHLVARSSWGQHAPGILVLSHLDTVHPLGFIERLPFRIDGDRAFGPGIYDMKGGAYLAYRAFRQICAASTRPPLGITQLLCLRRGDRQPDLARADRSGGTESEICAGDGAGARGRQDRHRAQGRRALRGVHQGRARALPAQGRRTAAARSANSAMSSDTLEAMNDFSRGISVNVGVVSGGTRPNVIAEEAYAEVDMRVPTIADADELVPKILGLKSRTDGVSVRVTGELNRPPYEKGNAGAALYEHAKTLAAEIGFDLVDTFTGGGSDGNFTAPHTATLDGLGVDGEGAHTHYEQMYISSIEPRTRLLYRLYQTLR